ATPSIESASKNGFYLVLVSNKHVYSVTAVEAQEARSESSTSSIVGKMEKQLNLKKFLKNRMQVTREIKIISRRVKVLIWQKDPVKDLSKLLVKRHLRAR